MNRLPVVDAVIPVYNRKEIFFESLESVLNQTYDNIQIYIIEDGTNLLKNINHYFSDKRIHYFPLNSNQGPSFSRNYGASLGKGDYIAFLDSDDLWEKNKIRKQVNFMLENPDLNWVHTNEIWFKDNIEIKQKRIHRKQGGFFFERLMERCLISPSSVLFKRDFFINNNGFLETLRVAEDYELWMRLNLFHEIGYIDEPLTVKRAGNWDQLSRTTEIDKYRVLALHRIYRLYSNKNEFFPYREKWKMEILKKINILVKGAQKYNKKENLRKYQSWLKLFTMF